MAQRYVNNSYVIGVDLRNELREATVNGTTLSPTWGTNITATDWRKAAIEVTKLIQSKNANLLIIVEGIGYASDLTGVGNYPILDSDLLVPNKLLYSAHNYAWFQKNNSYYAFEKKINEKWGYIFQGNKSAGDEYLAPVWLGEFGTCHHSINNCLNGTWWKSITRYLYEYDISWAFWDYPGTKSTTENRRYGDIDKWGLLNSNWDDVYNMNEIQDLQQYNTSSASGLIQYIINELNVMESHFMVIVALLSVILFACMLFISFRIFNSFCKKQYSHIPLKLDESESSDEDDNE
eukprot:426484_1